MQDYSLRTTPDTTAEHSVIEIWKQPARLRRWRDHPAAVAAQPLEIGSLEEMIILAVNRGATAADERDELFIDIGGTEALCWAEIRQLHASPGFPVEI